MSFSDKAVIDGQVSITEYSYLTGISNYIRAFDSLYLTTVSYTHLTLPTISPV